MSALWGMGICFLLLIFLPRWAEGLSRRSYSVDAGPAEDRRVFNDPELGEVWHDPDRNMLEIEADHEGRPIAFQLFGAKDIPAGMDLLRALHRDFERLERRARAVCARDLLAEANEEWRGADLPALDGEGFEAHLTLLWLVAESDGAYRLAYSFDEGPVSRGLVVEGALADGPISADLET